MALDRDLVSPWAVQSLLEDVANRARAKLEGSADNVARAHGGLRLTQVGHQFLAYWSEARGGKPIPSVEDINPARIAQLLPYIRYLHWEGDRLVHRLFGSALVEAIGLDLTGIDMFDFVTPANRDVDRTRLKLLHSFPCGLVVVAESPNLKGDKLVVEMTFLPVAGGDGKPDRLIGTIMRRTRLDSIEGGYISLSDQNMFPDVLARLYVDVGAGVPSDLAV